MYDNPNQLKSVAPERPSTEIEGCLSRASNALDRLSNRLNAIEDRLHPVMRATGAGQQGGKHRRPAGSSVAAGRFDSQHRMPR